MSYSKAVEILGLTTPKSLALNAKLAKQIMDHLDSKAPIRYHVACSVVINAAK